MCIVIIHVKDTEQDEWWKIERGDRKKEVIYNISGKMVIMKCRERSYYEEDY